MIKNEQDFDLIREETQLMLKDKTFNKVAKTVNNLLDRIEDVNGRLARLLIAFDKIDIEYCSLLARCSCDVAREGMIDGDEYEELMQVAIDTEEYLQVMGREVV